MYLTNIMILLLLHNLKRNIWYMFQVSAFHVMKVYSTYMCKTFCKKYLIWNSMQNKCKIENEYLIETFQVTFTNWSYYHKLNRSSESQICSLETIKFRNWLCKINMGSQCKLDRKITLVNWIIEVLILKKVWKKRWIKKSYGYSAAWRFSSVKTPVTTCKGTILTKKYFLVFFTYFSYRKKLYDTHQGKSYFLRLLLTRPINPQTASHIFMSNHSQ